MGFPLSYDIVAPQMRSLQKLETALQRLDLRWEVIDTTARIVCPGEAAGFLHTLDQTRTAFATLAQEMVEHIATTHLSNRMGDLASRAQVAIDILVRNLFERTADVGFIAPMDRWWLLWRLRQSKATPMPPRCCASGCKSTAPNTPSMTTSCCWMPVPIRCWACKTGR